MEQALNINNIGIYDNFFEIGGNSLKIIAMHDEIDKIYPEKVQVTDIFAYPTIYKLAEFIESKLADRYVAATKEQEITSVEVLEEYLLGKDESNTGNVLSMRLEGDSYRKLLKISNVNNLNIMDIMLSGFVFITSQITVKGKIALDTIINDTSINQLNLDISTVDNFFDLPELIEKQLEYSMGNIKYSRLDSSVENNISLLFLDRNKTKNNYYYLYDLIMSVYVDKNQVQITCEYNNEKLRANKIEELFNSYKQLIEAIINN